MIKNNRKIALVANHIKMSDEDALDIDYWLTKTPTERLAEVLRLRKNYYTWTTGSYPDKIEKVINRRRI